MCELPLIRRKANVRNGSKADISIETCPWRPMAQAGGERMKRLWRRYYLIVGVAFVIGAVAMLIWKAVEVERCYDDGGIIVAPLMRDQECFMPRTEEDEPLVRPKS